MQKIKILMVLGIIATGCGEESDPQTFVEQQGADQDKAEIIPPQTTDQAQKILNQALQLKVHLTEEFNAENTNGWAALRSLRVGRLHQAE